ncbi:MAG: DUF5696 domain-containing protein, partial [Oscillospiraceae bacterium]|nr:DUF5696 domain-containing protein [Oscillospiraceae bacterium]
MTAAGRRAPNRLKFIPLAAILAAALAFGAYQLHLTLRYRLYDGYKAALAPQPEYSAGEVFKPLGQGEGELSGYALALENDYLALYVGALSGEDAGCTAALDKRSGRVVYSNPPDARSDPIANPANKETLLSQLIVTYFDQNGRTAEVNSYKMAALLGQVAIESIPDGVRLIYTLGDTKPKAGLIPVYITRERLDEVLGMMDERTRNLLARRWEAVDGRPDIMKLLTAIINNPNQSKSMAAQFEKIGYTDEDRRRDEAETGLADESVGFVIPMEYRLDGDSLLVSIPSPRIQEMGGASIESVRVLPCMGAAGTDETGYFVVPNGSGSLIRFNNGKTSADEYRQYVYGYDPLLMNSAMLDLTSTARLPLFGIEREGGGVLARIENGAPLAQITASVAGRLNSYNLINAVFMLRSSSIVTVSAGAGESMIPVVERRKAELDITIRYSFLTSEYAGYSGMARYERERLLVGRDAVWVGDDAVRTVDDRVQNADDSVQPGDIPAFIDIIGSVTARRFFLDFAYEGQTPMTTYEQAAAIVGALASAGVERQFVNYQGW